MTEVLGKKVTVTVDRPLGSRHPQVPHMIYPVNYGYVEGAMGGDGEWQDAYILGVGQPLDVFEGRVVAVIHRLNDCEDKWVVVPEGLSFSAEEITDAVRFQEQYFRYELFVINS